MHISDGVLSPYIVGIGWAIALPVLGVSVRRLRADQVGAYGVVAAAFFAGSTIHVPVGPFSMHLVLNGMAGLLLGWGALTIVTVGLLLQALLISFGGLMVLGINISIMALPGAIMGALGRHWIKQASPQKRPWIGSLVGGGTILISALLLYITLSTTNTALMPLAKLVFLGHIPIAIVEGIVSFWLVHFLQKVKPSLLGV
ncbi:MAG: cobalt transporter CbiM [Candidatus Brocadia sp.]|nr:Cobalt transport protein CbiM [Anaerolineales bacterium]MCC6324207.1 cobalt transporter CbiM [Candidatus Brocadia sp.]MCE7911778.1 cobalt transporter CbiM [Candidatus Brocadia sp. AMX3]MDG5995961.1 cobalt transporter CbiM [Candidatus Brocadia sp.]RIJ89586.1 MAG: cobalt transporter CbiM [Candidatus Brocadia sp.]